MRAAVLILLLCRFGLAQAETLTLVAPDYWCPFSCATGGTQEGFTIEIVRAIYEPRGISVSYGNVNYARALEMVRSGSKTASPSTLKDEAPDFVFPSEPISRNRFCLFTKPDASLRYTGAKQLPAGHYGVIQGYSYGSSIDALIQQHPEWFEHLSGDGLTVQLARMVNANRIDAFIEEENLVSYTQSQHPELPLRNAGCEADAFSYVAFSPQLTDSVRYAKLFDEGFRQLRASGKLQQILSRYGLNDWRAKRP